MNEINAFIFYELWIIRSWTPFGLVEAEHNLLNPIALIFWSYLLYVQDIAVYYVNCYKCLWRIPEYKINITANSAIF